MDVLLSQLRSVVENDSSFLGQTFLSNYAKVVFGHKSDIVTQKAATSLAKEIKVFINTVNKTQKESGVELISLDSIEKKVMYHISNSFDVNSKVVDGDIALEKFRSSIERDELLKDSNSVSIISQYTQQNELSASLISEIQSNFSSKKAMYNALGQYEILKTFINRDYKTCLSWTDFVLKMGYLLKNALLEVQTYEHDAANSLDLSSVTLAEVKNNNDNSKKIATGYKVFDSILTGGFQPQRIYMFGGVSGGGKSLTLVNFTYRAKLFLDHVYRDTRNKHSILYLSLENSVTETRDRFVCCSLSKSISQIDRDVQMGQAYESEELYKRIFSPENVTINIVYRPAKSITALDVQSIITDIEKNSGRRVDICFIDYADKMSAVHSSKGDQEWRDLGYIVDELKSTAIGLNIPVVTVTQLNRDAYSKSNNSYNQNNSTRNILNGGNNTNNAPNFVSGGSAIAGSVRKRENVDFFAIFNFKANEKRTIDPDNLVDDDFMSNQKVLNSDIEQVWCTIDKNRAGPDSISFPVYIDYSSYRMLNHPHERLSYKQYDNKKSGGSKIVAGFEVN